MTTKSPLIRRLGNGYCASGDGVYLYDEDFQRILARVAELTESASPVAPAKPRTLIERRAETRDTAKVGRTNAE